MLRHGFDSIDKAKYLTEEQRDKLRHEVTGLFIETDKTKEESNLEYYKTLNGIAKMKIEDMPHETKLKAVQDSLDAFYLWNNQMSINSKLFGALKELKKKK
jgi:hypothetical protein